MQKKQTKQNTKKEDGIEEKREDAHTYNVMDSQQCHVNIIA